MNNTLNPTDPSIISPAVSPSAATDSQPLRQAAGPKVRLVEFQWFSRLMDLGLLNAALYGCRLTYLDTGHLDLRHQVLYHCSLTILWLLVTETIRLYSLTTLLPGRAFYQGVKCAFVVPVLYHMIPWVTPLLPVRRIQLLILPITSVLLIGMWRLCKGLILRNPNLRARAILVGTGSTNTLVLREWNSQGKGFEEVLPYELCGFVGPLADCPEALTHLGEIDDLDRVVDQVGPDEIVLGGDLSSVKGPYLRSVLNCMQRGIHIVSTNQLIEITTGKLALGNNEGSFAEVAPLFRGPSHRVLLGMKRVFDVAVGLIGCILTILVVPLLWLANLIGNRGPLLYSQTRVGRGGVHFRIYKFRSMVPDAEASSGAVFCQDNDPRVTGLGRFLRRSRIDELPQFFNVLKGEMSLVGPRPERPEFVAQFSELFSFYAARHAVQPGLTGWAQVEYRYGASQEDALEKLKYDLFYVKHQSLYLDYLVILRTIQVVTTLGGR